MTSATHATPAVCSNLLPERQATPQADSALRGPEAFYSDCASFRDGYRGLSSNQPAMQAAAQSALHHGMAAMAGNSEDPTRTGQTPGAMPVVPGDILAFLNTWVSAPPRIVITRPDYGPQYNGVGECPF